MKYENREDWLNARKGKITASQAAAICGCNPYQSPLALWAELTGRTEPFEGNFATRAGQALEQVVAAEYAERNGLQEVDVVPYGMELIVSKRPDWAAATPDFLVQQSKILETKTGRVQQQVNWQDEPPLHYVLQVQWQLFCTGFQEADICAVLGADNSLYFQYPINSDGELHEMMLSAAEVFREHLANDTPPESGAADAQLISKLYPSKKTEIVFDEPTSGEITALVFELDRFKELKKQVDAQAKEFKEGINKIENTIRLLLAGNEVGTLTTGLQIINKNIQNKGYTVEGFSYDRLTIKKPK